MRQHRVEACKHQIIEAAAAEWQAARRLTERNDHSQASSKLHSRERSAAISCGGMLRPPKAAGFIAFMSKSLVIKMCMRALVRVIVKLGRRYCDKASPIEMAAAIADEMVARGIKHPSAASGGGRLNEASRRQSIFFMKARLARLMMPTSSAEVAGREAMGARSS